MVKTLSELKEKEKHYPLGKQGSKFKSHVTVKVCTGCHKELGFDFFPKSKQGKYGSKCKDCLKKDLISTTKKHANKIYAEIRKFPDTKKTFTSKYVTDRLKMGRPTVSMALKSLVEDKRLRYIKDGVQNIYFLPENTPNVQVKDVLKDSPKDTTNPKTVVKTELNGYDDIVNSLPEVHPIIHKLDLNKSKILDLIDLVYKDAERIHINPSSREITIRMKSNSFSS